MSWVGVQVPESTAGGDSRTLRLPSVYLFESELCVLRLSAQKYEITPGHLVILYPKESTSVS